MGRRTKSLTAVVALTIAAVGAAFQTSTEVSAAEADECVRPVRSIHLTTEQDANARLIVETSKKLELPDKASEVAIAVALAQSSMRNLPPKAEDPTKAQGMFQQRVAVYPGIDLTDPVAATEAFLDRIVSIDGWEEIPNGEVAQAAVDSARHDLYDGREVVAKNLAVFYSSDIEISTTCGQPELAPVEPGPSVMPTDIPGIVEVRGIRVHESIVENIEGLFAAAEADGLTLGVNSSWRDPQKQIELRRQNCGTTNFDIYKKRASLCSPPTAKPGQSRHEKGMAIDFADCSTRSTICYKWLNKNAARFGLKNLPSEAWHWSTTGG